MMNFQWLFIDIGGPLLDDGPLFDYLAAALRGILVAQGHQVSGERFEKALKQGWQAGAPSTLDYIIQYFVTSPDDYRRAKKAYWEVFQGLTWEEYRRLQILRPGVTEALQALAVHHRLATLSNNVVRVKKLLEEYGIARFFSVWGISEAVGYAKPDHRLFQHVLSQAGCQPAEVMMVGDRLDNDILPARELGLSTALVVLKQNFGAPPKHVRGIEPDIRVNSLSELAQYLASRSRRTVPEETAGISRRPS